MSPSWNLHPCVDHDVYGGLQCDSTDIIYVFRAIKPAPQCVHFLVIYESYPSNYLLLPQYNKKYIHTFLSMLYAQTELISFFLFNLKGFSPSIGSNSLSCYRTGFHEIAVCPECILLVCSSSHCTHPLL